MCAHHSPSLSQPCFLLHPLSDLHICLWSDSWWPRALEWQGHKCRPAAVACPGRGSVLTRSLRWWLVGMLCKHCWWLTWRGRQDIALDCGASARLTWGQEPAQSEASSSPGCTQFWLISLPSGLSVLICDMGQQWCSSCAVTCR